MHSSLATEQDSQPGIVLSTVGSEEQARAIARTVVQERLAACVTVFPIQSVYTWQGKIHEEGEWQLVIKTDLRVFDRLSARMGELHPYDVPEMIAVAIAAGSAGYLRWLQDSCG